MRPFLVCLLVLWVVFAKGQTYSSVDTTKHNTFENRYDPFHRTIKDTVHKTISTFGHYFSVGLGAGHDYKYGGLIPLKYLIGPNSYRGTRGEEILASYSLAYKSHLLSITGGIGNSGLYTSAVSGYLSNYYGCLIGESIRFKHILISLSAGIASTFLFIQDLTYWKTNNPIGVYLTTSRVVSFPIELKTFLLARNGIGIGIHLSENIMPIPKYSPFSIGVCIVSGYWNKLPKKKKTINPTARS